MAASQLGGRAKGRGELKIYENLARQALGFSEPAPPVASVSPSSVPASSSCDIQQPSSSSVLSAQQQSKQHCLTLLELRGDDEEGSLLADTPVPSTNAQDNDDEDHTPLIVPTHENTDIPDSPTHDPEQPQHSESEQQDELSLEQSMRDDSYKQVSIGLTPNSDFKAPDADYTDPNQYVEGKPPPKGLTWEQSDSRKTIPLMSLRTMPKHSRSAKNNPVDVFEDHAQTFSQRNEDSGPRTKHLLVEEHYLNELESSGIVKFRKVDTREQIADVLTKYLPKDQMDYCWISL
eukprot:g3260.t1